MPYKHNPYLWAKAIFFILLPVILINLLLGVVVWVVWEEVMHAGLGLPRLGFWQVIGLIFLLSFFGSFFRSKK